MLFRKNREENGSWHAFTDLTVALLSLFILAFVAMATLKEQKAEDLTRTEEEVLSCQEEMRRIATERNALLSKSLKNSIEKGLIALENGNIHIQASLLFPLNGAELTSEGKTVIQGIAKGLLDVLDTGDVIMLSCTVRAQQTDNLALFDVKRHIVHNSTFSVTFNKVFGSQHHWLLSASIFQF